MSDIFHILTQAEWREALRRGEYAAASLATEGFIHCSTAAQVVASANRHFQGRADLYLLRIDAKAVTATLKYENTTGGIEAFPHLYGPLNLAAVTGVAPMPSLASGAFQFPAGSFAPPPTVTNSKRS